VSEPADYIPLVTGDDDDDGLTAEEARALADKVMGLGSGEARNVDALIDFLARGQ
jgi:hypothetical protein